MYETFFNLKHKPFSLLPDPDFLYLSSKHALALSLLEYCLSGQAGFCVITGEIGSGKTTLVRAFLGRVGREFTVGIISNTHNALHDVSTWALSAFGQKATGATPAETYQDLMSYLIAEYGEGRQCILIVDEAQNLSIDSLEELRLLSNINSGKDLLLQIVLVGQPELLGKLKRPELSQFAQRIAVSHHLAPLAYGETRQYIEHRLNVAGTDRPIFTEMAMGTVQYFSGGVPRLINSICDLALVYAFADGRPVVTEDLVFRVVADRQNSGIAPFARSEAADDPSVRAEISQLAGSVAGTTPAPRDEMPAPRLAEPRIEPEPFIVPSVQQADQGDYYFRNGAREEDDLLLTAETLDGSRAAAGIHGSSHSPESPVLGDPALEAGPVVHNGSLRHRETMKSFDRLDEEDPSPLRPSWQTPAVSLAAPAWPSINKRTTNESAASPVSSVANLGGTETPPRRSWWRRSFSRGN